MIEDSDDLRTKGKKVNKNGWQAKVYRAVWNKEPRFRGYCPFFWSVWGSVLLAIPVWILRTIVQFFSWAFSLFEEKYETYYEAKLVNRRIKRKLEQADYKPSDKLILFIGNNYEYLKRESYNIYSFFGNQAYEWFDNNREAWISLYDAAKARNDETVAKEAKRIQAAAARAEKVRKLIKPALIVSGLVTVWYLVQFVIWLIASFNGAAVLAVLGAIGLKALYTIVFALCLIALILTVYGLGKAVVYLIGRGISEDSFFRQVIVAGISEIFGFMKETIKMLYIKECPLIEWGDEDGPITKRK